jgi:hypothetical protein
MEIRILLRAASLRAVKRSYLRRMERATAPWLTSLGSRRSQPSGDSAGGLTIEAARALPGQATGGRASADRDLRNRGQGVGVAAQIPAMSRRQVLEVIGSKQDGIHFCRPTRDIRHFSLAGQLHPGTDPIRIV